MIPRRPLLGGLVGLALALAPAGAPAREGDALLVGAASSLRAPLQEIVRDFEAGTPGGARVRTSFGASSALFAQIRAGAPLDVFVCADERLVERLRAEGLVAPGSGFALAGNRLVVVAAPERVAGLRRPEDLLGAAVGRLALPAEAVPLGHYARGWLARAGLLEALRGRILPTEDARATLAAVDFGHADAAVVYASDARLARRARVAFPVPEALQPRIVYVAARVQGSPRRAAAERFLAALRSPQARGRLAAAGFAAAPGEAQP